MKKLTTPRIEDTVKKRSLDGKETIETKKLIRRGRVLKKLTFKKKKARSPRTGYLSRKREYGEMKSVAGTL